MYYYVVNPAAGRGAIAKAQSELQVALRELGIGGEFVKTLGSDDVVKVVRAGLEKGATTIVAVGGDGTLSEVIRVVYGEPGVSIGVIPTGSRNRLAHLLGVADWKAAPAILAARKIEPVDLGEVGGRYFIGEVEITAEDQTPPEHSGGSDLLSRLRALPDSFFSSKRAQPQEVSLMLDDKTSLKAPSTGITISNTPLQPHFAFSTPDPQDRKLDVVVWGGSSARLPLRSVGAGEGGDFSLFKAHKIEVMGSRPLSVYLDGQRTGSTPATIQIAEKRVSLIVGRERGF